MVAQLLNIPQVMTWENIQQRKAGLPAQAFSPLKDKAGTIPAKAVAAYLLRSQTSPNVFISPMSKRERKRDRETPTTESMLQLMSSLQPTQDHKQACDQQTLGDIHTQTTSFSMWDCLKELSPVTAVPLSDPEPLLKSGTHWMKRWPSAQEWGLCNTLSTYILQRFSQFLLKETYGHLSDCTVRKEE